jgi:hypothetical protein
MMTFAINSLIGSCGLCALAAVDRLTGVRVRGRWWARLLHNLGLIMLGGLMQLLWR